METFNFLGSVAKKMMLDFEDSKIFNHNGVKGTVREKSLINEFLLKYLPDKYRVGSGVIVNADGNQSRQQDIFLYDAFNSPLLFNDEEIRFIPIESIYCTIEVKSTLSKEELRKSVENIRSVKSLVKNNEACIPSGFIFAYKSDSSMETVCKNLIELNNTIPIEQQVNAICILEKGIIVYFNEKGLNQISTSRMKNTFVGSIAGEEDKNLILFYLLLLEDLMHKRVTPPDLLHYAKAQGMLDNNSYHIPRQEFSDETFYILGENKIYLKKVYEDMGLD